MTLLKTAATEDKGYVTKILSILLQVFPIFKSIGILPKKGIDTSSAKSFPPSLEKIFVHSCRKK